MQKIPQTTYPGPQINGTATLKVDKDKQKMVQPWHILRSLQLSIKVKTRLTELSAEPVFYFGISAIAL